MKFRAKYVYHGGMHKIQLMAGGSPFYSGHAYKSKASAVVAAKRLNEKMDGVRK